MRVAQDHLTPPTRKFTTDNLPLEAAAKNDHHVTRARHRSLCSTHAAGHRLGQGAQMCRHIPRPDDEIRTDDCRRDADIFGIGAIEIDQIWT